MLCKQDKMSRKKKSNGLETLITMMAMIIQFFITLLIRIVVFFYDLISFYTTKYKQKSGNNFIKTYFDKGNYGEFQLYRKVIRVFSKESVLTNLYLDNINTETTEIDILAVSEKGIYVFEMKNYSGYIYGSENDKNWTQVLNKRTKNKFYNPLRQNYAHTKAVESYLSITNDKIVPMVVFSNRSKLSKINISDNIHVYQFSDAMKYIKRLERKGESIISSEKKQDYLVKLLDKCHMSDDVKQKHIKDVIDLKDRTN